MCVFKCTVERNVADEVNQVSLELSHAALSLSGERGRRAWRGEERGGVFPQGRPHASLHSICISRVFVSDCRRVRCPVWHDN